MLSKLESNDDSYTKVTTTTFDSDEEAGEQQAYSKLADVPVDKFNAKIFNPGYYPPFDTMSIATLLKIPSDMSRVHRYTRKKDLLEATGDASLMRAIWS